MTIYQAIREGQSYGRLIQQITRRGGKWLYRYCMYSGGAVRFCPWFEACNASQDSRTVAEWKELGYAKLTR